ncbi:MAG: DNA helicase UvrD [Candidatus Omnitrophica bacterium CG_4_9_14_0_2_um_filter_42_8]|nr:MAG: DNA helicase UvrD [Candidatus Omnitrophica bacterium CG22_combo_CG10-13_8_21_14_all_43_16]PJC48206.1 MAG: DNA helicase UvrD [Candidatus Omnitrophica bacterium CG_4_9_14_0_2_um_filter_42_8]
MKFTADLHIHSKYSRATSPNMNIKTLSEYAKLKGIALLGTGDFTHHLWLEELKNTLKDSGNGLFEYNGVNFMLTGEISSIYSKNGKVRKIHNIIFAPSFDIADKINSALSGYGNIAYDGRPIIGIDAKNLAEVLFGISKDIFLVPGHIWTPWFSLFGSKSGFDSIEECFEEYTKDIYALETGLSSDPAMNWQLSKLDRFSLISNSDSHSPQKIGREANVFNTEMSYKAVTDALKKKDKKKFLYTVEFFPEEGKYHYDGHRLCNIRFSPQETKKNKNICPKCGKPLTIGVMNRVSELADRPEGFVPENSIPFKRMIPLAEIIADTLGVGDASKAVDAGYRAIIPRLGTEFEVLMEVSQDKLLKELPVKIAKAIINVRKGDVNILPGFDGEYGTIEILKEEDAAAEKQLNLF